MHELMPAARWLIALRLFAETDDLEVADDLASVVVARAGRFGEVRTRPVERYWKIPEYFEVDIELHLDGEVSAAYEGVLADLATGWERHGSPDEPWAIWNPSSECQCFSALVTWMSLDVFKV